MHSELLTSNSVIKCLLSEMASLVWGVENLIVEDGEVQGETKTDRVGGSEVGSRNFGSSFICFQRLICRYLALITKSKLGQVTMVVTLPVSRY